MTKAENKRAYNRERMRKLRNKDPEYSRGQDFGNAFRRAEGHLRERSPHAAVKWADRSKIRAIYERAAKISRKCGIPHQVDHIVPLRSNEVCGLHCEQNLRIVTDASNKRKNNSFERDNNVDLLIFPKRITLENGDDPESRFDL